MKSENAFSVQFRSECSMVWFKLIDSSTGEVALFLCNRATETGEGMRQ